MVSVKKIKISHKGANNPSFQFVRITENCRYLKCIIEILLHNTLNLFQLCTMSKSPAVVQQYLEEVEAAAEEVITDQQEIVTLDRRRNTNREALRQLQTNNLTGKSPNSRTWICVGNMFLKMPKNYVTESIEKGGLIFDIFSICCWILYIYETFIHTHVDNIYTVMYKKEPSVNCFPFESRRDGLLLFFYVAVASCSSSNSYTSAKR